MGYYTSACHYCDNRDGMEFCVCRCHDHDPENRGNYCDRMEVD